MKNSDAPHTPGPWIVERDGWNNQRIFGKDSRVLGESRFIAEVSLDYDGAEANALVIAAAPCLLTAAEEALALLQKGAPGWGVAKDLLRAAIHKAKP
jgi:hypothetical protein